MMSHIYLIAYIIVGLLTAVSTMRIFPPMEGFRPALALRFTALIVFIALWPVLISLAIWYFVIGYIGRNRRQAVKSRGVELMTPDLGQLQGSKPR